MVLKNVCGGHALRIAVGITVLVLMMTAGAGAKYINATGGDCISFGTWNAATMTCTMTTDLTESIQIDSNGVTLDGNGHTIIGFSGGTFYLSGKSGIIIKNTNIGGGVNLQNSNNNYLINNTIMIYSISLTNSSNNTLSGNNALIFLSSSSDNTLMGNNASIYLGFSGNNILIGNNALIFLSSSSNNTLMGNNASISLSNSSNNILIENNAPISLSSSSNNMLMGNNASNNNETGIFLSYSSGNILGRNNASNNTYGIFLSYSSNNTLLGNTANSNSVYGIYLPYSSNNTLLGNTANSNSVYGIYLSYSGGNNMLNGNNVSNNSHGIYLFYSGGNNTLTGNNASNNYDGIAVFGSSNTLTGNTANSNNLYGISLSGSNNTLSGNNVSNNSNGIYLSDSNNTVSNNNASSNSFAGINVGYSSNYNMLNNNTPNSNNGGFGIYLGGSNNILTANNASNNSEGVGIGVYGSNNMLIGNTANSNNWDGIFIYFSSNNTLSGNTANSNNGYGISLSNSRNSMLIGNNASSNNGNDSVGIILISSSNNTLSGNTMSDNKYNFGLHGDLNNDLNTISDSDLNNTIDTSNTVDGKPIYYIKNAVNQVYGSSTNAGVVYCISCNNVTFEDLTLTKNHVGIYLRQTHNSIIKNILVSKNSIDGIYLSSSSNNNLIGNNASLNNYYGIYLFSSNNNDLANNTASLNYKSGIYLFSSNNNDLTDNTASLNYKSGIHLSASSNNYLIGNSANLNKNYGIDFTSPSNNITASSNNSLIGNTLSLNTYLGVILSSSDNIIYNNYFNNINNLGFSSINVAGIWNITKTSGTNIIGGPYIGGNYWANPGGTGFSQKCTDGDNDGICDSSYKLFTNNFDYLPLTLPTGEQAPTFNISGFKLNASNNNGLPGWNIRLLNATTGLEIANKTTNSSGFYNFSDIPNGIYNLTEVMKPGWVNLSAMSQIVTINGMDATNKNFTNALIPQVSTTITVLSPNGGENWTRGKTQMITWTSTGSPGTYVKIELLKAGVLKSVIIASTLNDGSHPWLIPATQTPGTDYKIRITSTTSTSYTDISDNNFTIPAPNITVSTPNGGENWRRGTTQTIKWNSSGSPGTYVKIDLLKGGVLNRLIIASTVNDGAHPWLIPAAQAAGTDYKVRITSTTNAAYNDTSDENFTIPTPSITIATPNGGENWTRGTTKIINWNSTESPGSYVKIELLRAGVLNRVIISNTLNDGSHPWLIPATLAPGNDYKVKITSTINVSNNDTSDGNFTIPVPSFTVVSPDGGENWTRGTTKNIRWNSTESPGTYVKIELLKAGVLNRVIISSTLNDGSHPWLIPATQIPGNNYKVRITSIINTSNKDMSDDNFTIPAPSIIVVSPNGGENWTRGTSKIINWSSTESPGTYVKIELLKAGVLNRVIVASTLNDGSHPWLVPATLAPGNDYKVKITSTINISNNDSSDNNFTIPVPTMTVITPNGGENWTRGTTKIINWSSTESPGTYVKIELLKAGVLNRVIVASTINDGSHPWLIPVTQATGSDYRVKITSTANISNTDTGNNDFTIVS